MSRSIPISIWNIVWFSENSHAIDRIGLLLLIESAAVADRISLMLTWMPFPDLNFLSKFLDLSIGC